MSPAAGDVERGTHLPLRRLRTDVLGGCNVRRAPAGRREMLDVGAVGAAGHTTSPGFSSGPSYIHGWYLRAPSSWQQREVRVKVLVCGGRDYDHFNVVNATLSDLHVDELCTGGASGADSYAQTWAHLHQIDYRVYPARWSKDGKAAGPIRNARMLHAFQPDLVVAFPGGRGTADMVARARQAGVEVLVVTA